MSTKKKFYLAKSNQEGGTIENDFKEFSKYLMELIGATTDEELQNFVKEQGPEKVNKIYKQWKKQVPMAKDGMQFADEFANEIAVKLQKDLIPGNIAIRNKIQDTAQDDLRGISSFKEAFAEARRRGLKQFSWGKGNYTTELRRADPPPPPPKDEVEGKGGSTPTRTATKPAAKTSTPTSVPTPLQPEDGESLGVGTLINPGVVGAAGALYYGAKKYVEYSNNKLRTPRTPSAPKPSIFRNLGTNAREYLSKVPFKEKVNEYTSKAANLFKRTSAPVPPAAIELVAPPAAPAAPTPPTALRARAKAGTGAAAHSAPARTLRVKARAGEMARTLTAPPAAPPSAPAGSTAR